MQLRERISPSEGTFVNLTNLRNDGSLQSPGINRRFSRSSGMVGVFSALCTSALRLYVLVDKDATPTHDHRRNNQGGDIGLYCCEPFYCVASLNSVS